VDAPDAGWLGTILPRCGFKAPSRKSCRLPPVCVLAYRTELSVRAACASKSASAFDCALQQSQPVTACYGMNRSPSAISSSIIHRSRSRDVLRSSAWLNSDLFSGSCAKVQVHCRPVSALGMRSKRRVFAPFSVSTTRIVPASRSPLWSTAANPPAACTPRIRPATSRWAGSLVITPRPFRSNSKAARTALRPPELRPARGASPRRASAG
jgi:hypothetical protein